MFFKTISLFFVIFFVVVFAFSCSQPNHDVVNENENGNKIVEKDPNKIRLLYTAYLSNFAPKYAENSENDTKLINTKKFAQLSTVLQKLRNEGVETLTFSAGNDYGGAFYDEFYGVATAILLDKLGYNIIVPDVNEFTDGESIYDASIKDTSYDLLTGSTYTMDRSLIRRLKPYVIKEINNHKIGILTSNNLHGNKFNKKSIEVTQSSPNWILGRAGIISHQIDNMRKEGAEIIILLVERHHYVEINEILNKDLLDLDLAIFPAKDESFFTEEGFKMENNLTLLGKKKTPLIVYKDEYAKELLVLQVDIAVRTKSEEKKTMKFTHKFVKVVEDTPEDPEVKKMVDGFISQLP